MPFFIIFFLALAFKSTDALSRPQFWAEDGVIFFQQQFGHNLPQLWTPYAGYLHVVPRIVAWLASLGSPVRAPLVYNLLAILIDATALTFVAARFKSIIPVSLIFAGFLLTPTNGEIYGTITNCQWFLQFALIAAGLTQRSQADGWRFWLGDCALLLAALTGPFSVMTVAISLLFLFLSFADRRLGFNLFEGYLAAWHSRCDYRSLWIIAAGGLVQTSVLLNHLPASPSHDQNLVTLLKVCLADLIPIHIFGADFLTDGSWLAIYIIMLTALIFGRRVHGDHRLVLLGLCLFALLEAMLSTLMKDYANMYNFAHDDRYFQAIKTVFWWALFVFVVAKSSLSRRECSGLVLTCVGLVALSNANNLRRQPLQNLDWKNHARELSQPGPHGISVNPQGWMLIVENPPSGPPRK